MLPAQSASHIGIQDARKEAQRSSFIHVDAGASAIEALPELQAHLQEQVDHLVCSDYDFLQEAVAETDPVRGYMLYRHYFDKHYQNVMRDVL